MNGYQIRGKHRDLDGGDWRTAGYPGRGLVAALLLLMTTVGCSILQEGQTSHPQTPAQAPPSTASATGGHPSIVLGAATGAPGQDVTLTATLRSAGTQVAGTQNDLTFDAGKVSLGTGSKPSCRVNAAIGEGGTAFSFRPSGCQGSACSTVRALVFAMDNTAPIPDGAALYTCTLHISPSAAPGQYRIGVGGVILSTPAGQKVPNAAGGEGVLTVSGAK